MGAFPKCQLQPLGQACYFMINSFIQVPSNTLDIKDSSLTKSDSLITTITYPICSSKLYTIISLQTGQLGKTTRKDRAAILYPGPFSLYMKAFSFLNIINS